MNILFYLPNFSAYRDRALSLALAGESIGGMHLLFGNLDSGLPPRFPGNVAVIDAALHRYPRMYRRIALYQCAVGLMRQCSINILHDTFGMLLPIFMRRKRFPGVRLATSLYCLNAWRIRHVWGSYGIPGLLLRRSTALMLYGRWMERLICKYSDAVVLQAEGLIPRLLEDVPVPRGKIRVIPNSVDTDWWSPAEMPDISQNENSGTSILFAGTVSRSRGLFHMLEAFRKARRKCENLRLTLAGSIDPLDADDLRLYLRQFRLEDCITLTGRLPREALRDAMRQHDIFLYLSENDASPRTLLEAMATGMAAIVSRHPGIDTLDPKGKALCFAAYGDTGKVSEQISLLSQDKGLRRTKSVEARRIAAEHFDCRVVADAYAEFYNTLYSAPVPTG
jgi:glycosyltransferase involved in cell wall biosynthesis